jgi:hypothetical protein
MPQDDHANNDSSEANKKNNSASHAGLRWILITGIVLLLALLSLSIFHPNLSERVKFFTVNALSLLVLAAIAVQAYIYRRQWEAMQDSLAETRKMVEQNERAVEAAERSLEIAQENTVYAQRAYVSISKGSVWVTEEGGLFKMEIKNFGNTPANDVQIFSVAEVKEEPPVLDMSSAKWTQVGLLAPQWYIERFVPTASEITTEQRRLIANGSLKLFCSGVIQYQDFFGQTRHTKFCFYQRFGSIRFGPCATGNEAD